MRLAKYLAHAGVASRRAAEQIVRDGRVSVRSEVVYDPARDVDATSGVTVDGQTVTIAADRAVYALHKPRGVVSTARDTHGRRTVVDLVASPTRLYPVGRLDADASGLILLTDDGELANLLTHPRYEVPKTYLVRVERAPVRDRALRALRDGVPLEDGITAPARVQRVEAGLLELTVHEGRNRQIKRMCAAVGHPVRDLQRVGFGELELGDLASGSHRRLTGAEVQRLRASAASPP